MQNDGVLTTKVMGHRGASLLGPENTLAAIKAAAETGVSWVEIDVYPIAEGGLVIFHDDDLERCSNGVGKTQDALPSYVATLDAGSHFSPAFSGEKVPTLLEALNYIQELGLSLNLEIKYDADNVESCVPAIMAALAEHWHDNNKLIISSFNFKALQLCYQMDKSRHLAPLYEAIPANWQSELASINAYSLHCDYSLLTKEQALAVKSAGYKLLCYTANEAHLVASHWEWGMDAIITDDPGQFSAFME